MAGLYTPPYVVNLVLVLDIEETKPVLLICSKVTRMRALGIACGSPFQTIGIMWGSSECSTTTPMTDGTTQIDQEHRVRPGQMLPSYLSHVALDGRLHH